jgi:hypothetical protein
VTAPYVGLPSSGTGCAFAAELDSPECGQPPALHIQVRSDAWGEVALITCADHASLARASGSWITEHNYGADCPESALCWLKGDTGSQPPAGTR